MRFIRPRAFTEYFIILWRRKHVIALVAGVIFITSWLVIGKLPDLYESQVTLRVSAQQSEESLGPLRSRVTAVTQQLISRPILEPIIRNLRLSREKETIEAAVERLQKEIKFNTTYGSQYPNPPETVTISWRHTDPQSASTVLAKIVAELDRVVVLLQKDAILESQHLKVELAGIEDQLHRLGRQRAVATVKRDATTPGTEQPISRAALITAIETLADKQYALERQIAELQRQIDEQQKQVAAQQKSGGSGSGKPGGNSAYEALLLRKTDLEAKLRNYASQYTEKNPKVIQANAELAEVNRQLSLQQNKSEAALAQVSTPESLELRTMHRELTRLQTDLDVTRRDLDRKKQMLTSLAGKPESQSNPFADFAENAQAGGEADTEYDLLMKRYDELREQQKALERIAGIVSGAPANLFKAVESPSLPIVPSAPPKMLLRLFALVLAIVLGLVMAIAIEASQIRYLHDERDVEYLLGVPCIGLISETLTLNERGMTRRRLLRNRLIWVGVAAVSIPVLVTLLTRPHFLQLIMNR